MSSDRSSNEDFNGPLLALEEEPAVYFNPIRIGETPAEPSQPPGAGLLLALEEEPALYFVNQHMRREK